MKRSSVLLFSCLAIAAGTWLAHVVLAQTAETKEEKKFTITQSQLDKYVADKIEKAVAAEHEKGGHDKSAAATPVSDEQVLRAENWHRAVFNQMEFVVYTGPGQPMMHHWIQPAKPAASKMLPPKSGASATPTPKGN